MFFTGVGPDGMTISRDGHLWVAVPGDGKIHGGLICYDAKTGEEITRVSHPASVTDRCKCKLSIHLDAAKGIEDAPASVFW